MPFRIDDQFVRDQKWEASDPEIGFRILVFFPLALCQLINGTSNPRYFRKLCINVLIAEYA